MRDVFAAFPADWFPDGCQQLRYCGASVGGKYVTSASQPAIASTAEITAAAAQNVGNARAVRSKVERFTKALRPQADHIAAARHQRTAKLAQSVAAA